MAKERTKEERHADREAVGRDHEAELSKRLERVRSGFESYPSLPSSCETGSGARAYEYDVRRFLSRLQLARLLAEIPPQWRPLFELLASTGRRISEAIGLRVVDAGLDIDARCVHVRRAIVRRWIERAEGLRVACHRTPTYSR